MHQQNMLQDYIRTGTYFAAITENPADFQGKAVMDVGCGSGILSLFAAQVGGAGALPALLCWRCGMQRTRRAVQAQGERSRRGSVLHSAATTYLQTLTHTLPLA